VIAARGPRRPLRRSDSTPSHPPRQADLRRALGRHGERLAAAHLRRHGFSILAHNVRTPHGEIDLIAWDGETIAFVEVKTRRVGPRTRGRSADPLPLDGLRPDQRRRLRRLAAAWLRDRRHARPSAQSLRFDAVGVLVDSTGALLRIDHLEGAW
jgi:putative endonuclease